MHRIDGPGATVDNKFTEGNPATSVPATQVTDDWLNDIQEELLSILAARSIAPVKGTQDQVLTAINQMIAASIPAGEDAGSIKAFALAAAPTGWLKANGAAVSRTTYAGLFNKLVTVPGYTAQTFTVTIASPGVFTKTAHGFANGERLRLSTTGALPTGLNNSTDYFVEKIDANTFYLSLTLLGTRIVTTGTQSGTHSYLQSWFGLGDGSTTFNLPDLRGEFIRGWDDGRGVDAGRTFGSSQLDAMQNITGEFHNWATNGQGVYATGVFGGGISRAVGGANTGSPSNALTLDASRQVRTATEERPRNVALLVCIKY